jgi:hypothetical protein
MKLTAAAQFIADGLAASLPPGVPPMYRIIIGARFTKKDTVVANLELFDGGMAEVRVSKWAPHAEAWSIAWAYMPGGDINWNGTAWERVKRGPEGEGAA